MKHSLANMKNLLCSVDKRRLRLAGFNLVGCALITVLLVAHAIRNEPYPIFVGVVLALLIGGSLTFATVWISLSFGRTPRR